MCKTKYFDGWTIKTRFFPSFLFAFFAVLSLSFGYEMPQQFYVSPLDRAVIGDKTTSFCVSLLGGGNFS